MIRVGVQARLFASCRPVVSQRRFASTSSDGTTAVTETPLYEIERIYKLQRSHEYEIARSTVDERKAKLQELHDTVMSYRTDIQEALYKDKGNHACEVDLAEIFAVTHEIKHVQRHLSTWMKPRQRVGTPLALLGSSSWIHVEPKGVCLVMSPWNFPVNLTLCPLVSAVAAGNTCMIKPSEISFHTSHVLHQIITRVFEEKEVAVVQGAVETSTNLLAQKFNHIFFTGAPVLGKKVMEAAAKHLASVTLELGGKSPTIIDETCNVSVAAKRLAWAKTVNAGQTCIAPDYVYVHESQKEEFVNMYSRYIGEFYGENVGASRYYARVINDRHYKRLDGVFDNAMEAGATVVHGRGKDNKTSSSAEVDSLFFEPTVMTNVSKESSIMKDEIFGPLLPIISFQSLDDPIAFINANEKPLAMYIYSTSNANTQYIIDNTRAGATCINHNMLHFFNSNLPFGGSNNSGIGKSHGVHGFKEFSNERAVLKQWSPLAGIDLMMPPYTNFKKHLIDLTIKLF